MENKAKKRWSKCSWNDGRLSQKAQEAKTANDEAQAALADQEGDEKADALKAADAKLAQAKQELTSAESNLLWLRQMKLLLRLSRKRLLMPKKLQKKLLPQTRQHKANWPA